MEFVQANLLGYKLTKVGGGSDGINEQKGTTEFKGTDSLDSPRKVTRDLTVSLTMVQPVNLPFQNKKKLSRKNYARSPSPLVYD